MITGNQDVSRVIPKEKNMIKGTQYDIALPTDITANTVLEDTVATQLDVMIVKPDTTAALTDTI